MDYALTVAELRAQLEKYDDDTPVCAAVSYGDRGCTMQAVFATGCEQVYATTTCYSDSGYKVTEDEGEAVILINYDAL